LLRGCAFSGAGTSNIFGCGNDIGFDGRQFDGSWLKSRAEGVTTNGV